MKITGPDGVPRDPDEHYDSQRDVEQDPFGAHLTIQSLWEDNKRLRDALEAMKGIFDTPIARRRISGPDASEARKMARDALK